MKVSVVCLSPSSERNFLVEINHTKLSFRLFIASECASANFITRGASAPFTAGNKRKLEENFLLLLIRLTGGEVRKSQASDG